MRRAASAAAILAFLTAATLPSAAEGPDHAGQVGAYFNDHVASWINAPEVIAAIRAQNERHATLSRADISRLDEAWIAEIKSEDNHRPAVQKVMENELSSYLKAQQRAADWMIVEIIVMDAKGLNVGLSTPSSDYWQGDEAKHQKTFQVASDALFIDAVEYEAETGLLLSQANKTIFDPATGAPLGAVTVSINMNKL